jgi:hypothetical protein
VLAAWARHDRQRLALLTSDPQDFLDITGNPDQHWTKVRWEGAMGSTYCSYENRAGDAIVIRISNQGLQQRQWHIAVLHSWEAMTYPQEPAKYADTFVSAWIQGYTTRMRQLAVPAVVDHFLELNRLSSDYTIETEGAAGTTYATIAHPSGFRQTIRIANEKVFLRQAQAIYGFE